MKDAFDETFSSVRKGVPFRLMHYQPTSYVGGTTTSTLVVSPDGSWNGTIKFKISADGKPVDDVSKTWVEMGSYTTGAVATIICTSDRLDYLAECTVRAAGSCQVVVR